MNQRTVIGVIATALVVTMVVLGLTVIGSPTKARNRETDRLRVERLNQLHYQLESHVREKGQLPDSLKELTPEGHMVQADRFDSTRDPETGDVWDYRRIGPTNYEICATFHEASEEQGQYSVPEPQPQFFLHGSGRQCFNQKVSRRLDFNENYSPRNAPAPVHD